MANLPEDFTFIGYQLAIRAERNKGMEAGRVYKRYKRIGIVILTKAIQQRLFKLK